MVKTFGGTKRMKRKLTKKELTLMNKGIENRKSRIEDYQFDLAYNKDYKKFHDKWEKHLEKKEQASKKKQKDLLTRMLESLTDTIKAEEQALIKELDMIHKGVEIKEKPKSPDYIK